MTGENITHCGLNIVYGRIYHNCVVY